jgi:GNAT superfamily N-acetyltransferase
LLSRAADIKARLRAARPDEREALGTLCLRSKAFWGYNESFLAAVAPHLRVGDDSLASGRVWVAVEGADIPLGVVEVVPLRKNLADLNMLFVEPAHVRKGFGRMLFGKALDLARALGAREMTLDSDPEAAGFYAAMGAQRIGAFPTGVNGRLLPRFRVILN